MVHYDHNSNSGKQYHYNNSVKSIKATILDLWNFALTTRENNPTTTTLKFGNRLYSNNLAKLYYNNEFGATTRISAIVEEFSVLQLNDIFFYNFQHLEIDFTTTIW